MEVSRTLSSVPASGHLPDHLCIRAIGGTDLNTKFYVTNKTNSLFVFAYGPSHGYFSMVDNKGRNWSVQSVPEGKAILTPQATTEDIGPRFDGKYLSDSEVAYTILTVKGLLGVSEARWKIDIVR